MMRLLCLFFTLLLAAPLYAQSPAALEDAFGGSLKKGPQVKLSKDWKRKVYFGDWSVQTDGSITAGNIAEQGHGPLVTFTALIKDAVIECEFMLPEEGPDRHFRIFLAAPDYLGHTVGAVSNISTKSFPAGLKLYHLRKGKNKKVEANIDFGQNELTLKGGQWYAAKLSLKGAKAHFSVDGIELSGSNAVLGIGKNRVSLNFGKAGGSIRNFRVSFEGADVTAAAVE